MRRRNTRSPRWSLALGLVSMACSSLTGRAPQNAPDGAVDAPTDASDDVVAMQDADAADVVVTFGDADDIPMLQTDAARCPGGATPELNLTDTRVQSGAQYTPLHGSGPRAGITDVNGRLYVVGACSLCFPGQRSTNGVVWRFDPQTLALDTTWGEGGVAHEAVDSTTADAFYAAEFDRSGRLLVVGYRASGVNVLARVARFDTAGRPDPSFGTNGRVVLSNTQVYRGLVRADARGILVDDDGFLISGVNNDEWNGLPTAVWFARFRENGTLDTSFGTSGIVYDATIHGCFDPYRDGTNYVFACTSAEGNLPALLRLDAQGRRLAWFAAPSLSVHPAGRPDFHARALLRDTAGRWIVAGVTSRAFMGGTEAPCAVRYLPDGRPDPTFGHGGVALVPALQQHVTFSLASAWRLTCDDRLVVGGIVGTNPTIAVLDANGRAIDGDDVWLGRASSSSTWGIIEAIVPLSTRRNALVIQYSSTDGMGIGLFTQ